MGIVDNTVSQEKGSDPVGRVSQAENSLLIAMFDLSYMGNNIKKRENRRKNLRQNRRHKKEQEKGKNETRRKEEKEKKR